MQRLTEWWRYIETCWRHAKYHWAAVVIVSLAAVYDFLIGVGIILKLPDWLRPDKWPKIPLAWFCVVALCGAVFVLLEGGLRNQRSLRDKHATEIDTLKDKLSDTPRIVAGDEWFYSDMRPLVLTAISSTGERVSIPHGDISCLHVRFKNDPKKQTENSIARNITAEIKFYDTSSHSLLCEVTGRWEDTPQPPELPPHESKPDRLATVNFQIGQRRELDIAFKHLTDSECYAISNDVYRYPDWRMPTQKLDARQIKARVTLRGVGVHSSWDLWFENPASGELKRIKLLALPPQQ